MKLKTYIEKLSKLDKELDLIYSTDDEGNWFSEVFYSPTVGYYDGESFMPLGHDNDFDYEEAGWKLVICLN